MAEYSYFFNSVSGDRKYKAEDFASYFQTLVTNGVMPQGTSLQVTPGTGMAVNLSAGRAIINGYAYYNSASHTLAIDPADGVLSRIDRIVLRWDRIERSVYARVTKGAPASSPTAPAIVRSADYYDLGIYTVLVPAGATGIIGGNINDTRLNTSVCGIISSAITPNTDGWYASFQAAFDAWFDQLQDTLDGDTAGNLFGMIQDITDVQVNSVTVSNGLWAADSTYANYPFKADISIPDARPEMIPDVIFDVPQQSSGKMAGVAHSGDGYVRIFATEAQATFTIPVIRLRKAVG